MSELSPITHAILATVRGKARRMSHDELARFKRDPEAFAAATNREAAELVRKTKATLKAARGRECRDARKGTRRA